MNITGPGQSPLLMLRVIDELNKGKIPYAIVGAFAASFYGLVRASLDADAVIFPADKSENLDRALDGFRKKSLKVISRQGDCDDPIRRVIHIEDKFQNRVDLLIGIKGMPVDVSQRALTAKFMNKSIHIVGVEDFIAMKLFAGGPVDIDDIVGVLKISADLINVPLLKTIAGGYGKKELRLLDKILKDI